MGMIPSSFAIVNRKGLLNRTEIAILQNGRGLSMRIPLFETVGIFLGASLALSAQTRQPELEAVETVVKALDRGYGMTCSLTGVPAPTGGYYRCIDIGPYRFMSEYNRMRAFVLVDGQPPYPVMSTESGRPEFLVKGPWQDDLAQRVRDWWSDEVEGGRSRRDSAEDQARRRREAERAVRRFSEPEAEPEDQRPGLYPQEQLLLPVPEGPYYDQRPQQLDPRQYERPRQAAPPPASLPAPMTAPRPLNPTARVPSQTTAPLPGGSIPLRSLPGGPSVVAPGVTVYPPGTVQNPSR